MKIRYIRDYLQGSNVNTGNHWLEIAAYDYSMTNVASNKTVTGDPAFDFYCFSQSSNNLKMLVDGVTSTDPYIETVTKGTTEWAAGLGYVQVDLEAVYDIKYIKTWHYWGDHRSYANKTEVSEDGLNWITLYDSAREGTHVETAAGFLVSAQISGLIYNDNVISQNNKSTDRPYYNSTTTTNVYYNGTQVWKKYTPLDFVFSGPCLTKYTGTASSVTIPSSYSIIADANGKQIYIEGTDQPVTCIWDSAFENNSSIISVIIPNTISDIRSYAFKGCYNLSTVKMSATPTYIRTQAFAVTNITSLSSYMYNCTSLGSGCFASRSGWHLQSPNGSRGLGGDAILNRLLATNTGGTISANGYTGAGAVYIIRSRFNVHKSGGTTSPSGGSFSCTATLAYSRTSFTSLSCSVAFGGNSSGYEYCIASTSVPTSSISVSMNSTPSNYSSWSGGKVANFTPSAGGTDDHDIYAYVTATCLAKGTLITLADGTQKPIENIKHSDLLLVWNFETGTYDYQYPLVVGFGSYSMYKTRILLDDHSHIDICGTHDIYDPVAHTFRKYGEGSINRVKDKQLYVLKYINKQVYSCRKIIDIMEIYEDTENYCLITGGTITAFANNIMIGSDILNYTGISETNTFPKSFTKDKETCYTYNNFKEEIYSDGPKYLILGLNMQYTQYYYNKDTTDYVEMFRPFPTAVRPNIKDNKYLCTIGLLDGDTLIESQYLEDEELILPKISSDLKTHWYIVGEYKLLKPGDKYKINFSTLIRAV